MITPKDVFNKLRRTYYQIGHAQQARMVLDTTPLKVGEMPFTVLSMVHRKDVLSYLIAIKSFAQFANPRRVVIVCDPSITAGDRQILMTHIPHAALRDADEFTHADIPRGGTWERLYAISEYARGDYVVQLDADTVTVQRPVEVIAAISSRVGFVLGERPDQKIITRLEAAEWSKRNHAGLDGIQCVVEASIDEAEVSGERYVRGCSGFTGFPKDPGMRDKLLAFSSAMKKRHKHRWTEWSTEQITSNYLVANAPGTTVLPFPKYGTPDVQRVGDAFSHFMGYLRFTSPKYEKTTRDAIRRLRTVSTQVVPEKASEHEVG